MRAFKAIYLSVLFALAMGLFCGELPESLRLLDDTTNDYVADSSASAARENEVARGNESEPKPAISEERTAANVSRVEHCIPAVVTADPSPVSGKELLPLLSIRRT